jgi:hypothetical protein
MALRPNRASLVIQASQPALHLSFARVFMDGFHERREIITDMQGYFGFREDAPHRAWQVVVANLGDPAAFGIVDCQCKRGSKYRVGFFDKPAPRKIDGAELGSGEPAAGAEQCPHSGAEDSRVGTLETLNHIRVKSRERLHR